MKNQKQYYDLAILKDMVGNDQEAVKRMVQIFLDATPVILNDIKASYEKGDFQNVAVYAHKLKSSVEVFAVEEVKEKVRLLERVAKEGKNMTEVGSLTEEVLTLTGFIFNELRENEL